jgi:nitrite reductase/ring-hydroxylating ferredoxin subunit
MSDWVHAAAVDDIRVGGAKSFAYLDKRIALFRTSGGVFASDNRCPHQGYALVRGDVKDGVLTCAWHNWKFELGTGTCRYVASPKRERFVFQSSSERTSMTLA